MKTNSTDINKQARITFTMDKGLSDVFKEHARTLNLKPSALMKLIISDFIMNQDSFNIRFPLSFEPSHEKARMTFLISTEQSLFLDNVSKTLDLKKSTIIKLLIIDFAVNKKTFESKKSND